MKRALAGFDAQNCCGAGIILNSGSVNSQGDVAHRANNARAAFGVNGAGIKIGVLSDSFNNSWPVARRPTSQAAICPDPAIPMASLRR